MNRTIKESSDHCFIDNFYLSGIWVATCNEQGQINIIIEEKYSKYYTLLDEEQFYHNNYANLYVSSSEERRVLFEKIYKKL